MFVSVGGVGVLVGGAVVGVFDGGTGVLVGVMGVGVFDGGTGVLVGGTGVVVRLAPAVAVSAASNVAHPRSSCASYSA